MACTLMFEKKNNQRGITWKLRKGEQLISCATHCPTLILKIVQISALYFSSRILQSVIFHELECTHENVSPKSMHKI